MRVNLLAAMLKEQFYNKYQVVLEKFVLLWNQRPGPKEMKQLDSGILTGAHKSSFKLNVTEAFNF